MEAEKEKKHLSPSLRWSWNRYRCVTGMLVSANTSQLSNHLSLRDYWPVQRHTCIATTPAEI